MSLIGACSDCGTTASLRYKPEKPVNEQSRPTICDRCADFRLKQATTYVRCEYCGQRLRERDADAVNVSAPDEYYPGIIHLCRDCQTTTNGDSNE